MRRRYYPHLKHAQGEEREDHKYVARVETGNPKYPWRYFYSWPAYNAYVKVKMANKQPIVPKQQVQPQQTAQAKSEEKPKENLWSKLRNAALSIGDKVETGIKSVSDSLSKIGSEKAVKSDKPDNKIDAAIVAKNFVDAFVNVFGGKKAKPTVDEDPPDDFSEVDKKDSAWTDDQDQEAINPDFDPTGETYWYTNNCAWCTAAYEMRQRGYDVEARGITPDVANTITEIMSWYDVTAEDVSYTQWDDSSMQMTADAVEQWMVNEGDGARGQFCIYWKNGGGHSVVWEVEDGNAYLRDCQTNEVVELEDYMSMGTDLFFFRTDNVELPDDILDAVKNRRD